VPNFGGKRILEIGCGDGRLTWRYARDAAHVTAIDPDAGKLSRALASRPADFRHVHFQAIGLEEFAYTNPEKFDLAILAWSL
jgi:2-polyprenyl-3-methyl-5-hydroxy-6-metoxy-1,4-benzoquinol methylase